MKIDPVKTTNMINKYEKAQKPAADNKVTLNNKDKVELSKDYAIYEKAMKALKETEGLNDVKKLDMIKEKITKNEYSINYSKLAEKIISKSKNNKE